jgi:hypothetical protein
VKTLSINVEAEKFEEGFRDRLQSALTSVFGNGASVRFEEESDEEKKKDEMNPDAAQKGQFIGAVMKELKGKADGKIVQETVNQLLS